MWSYYLKRLHSLSGLIPVGIYLMMHFFLNTYARHGPEAYNGMIAQLHANPILSALEVLIIAVPLAYHAIYGLVVTFTGSVNVGVYRYYDNWLYLVQRITGVIVLAFIIYHVYTTRLAASFYGTIIDYQFMVSTLSNKLIFAWYVVGVVAVAFHFGNGLCGMLFSWGITATPVSQKVARWVCHAIFVVIAIWGVGILTTFQ